LHEPLGNKLRDRLASWMKSCGDDLTNARPDMPDGVTDRAADVWEPLLAIADAAGGHWPELARTACVALVAAASVTDSQSLGVRLLADLRDVFGDRDAMSTEAILSALHNMEEAPWADLRGKPLNARGLASRLHEYGVRSRDVRIQEDATFGMTTERVLKGYRREDLHDVWARYVPVSPAEKSATSATRATPQVIGAHPVADVADSAALAADNTEALTSGVALVADVADSSETDERTRGSAKPSKWGWPE
jgi:Protein of unknown function (DUF3631)